jgi:hypothetical protein
MRHSAKSGTSNTGTHTLGNLATSVRCQSRYRATAMYRASTMQRWIAILGAASVAFGAAACGSRTLNRSHSSRSIRQTTATSTSALSRTSTQVTHTTGARSSSASSSGSEPGLVLTYSGFLQGQQYVAAPTERVEVSGTNLRIAIANRTLFLVNTDRLYVCQPIITGHRVVGTAPCQSFPRSLASHFEKVFADQYLHPFGPHDLYSALFTATSTSTHTIAGQVSTCKTGPEKVSSATFTLCASNSGGFATLFGIGHHGQRLQSVSHTVSPSVFASP